MAKLKFKNNANRGKGIETLALSGLSSSTSTSTSTKTYKQSSSSQSNKHHMISLIILCLVFSCNILFINCGPIVDSEITKAASLTGALAGGTIPLSSSLSSLSTSSLSSEKGTCPHGWTRYGSKKCLRYVNEVQEFDKAQSICRSGKHQGNLVTIHSNEEQNFVFSYIHSIAASSTPIWIGARQMDFESILWLDKSENGYTNWAPSQPSHPDEICIAVNPRTGLWHDVMCTEANVAACERAPTTQWPFFVAFCAEGWFQYHDEKCVRIVSSQALNFYESQELCRSKYNSKLLSIKTENENEFVHNLIKFKDIKMPVWLGALQNDFSSFTWIDKSDVKFTNWLDTEPNDPDHACVSMTTSNGKWSDNDCKEQKLILCQKSVNQDEGSCETGWLQFRQTKCYRFVHIRLSFDDAELLCSNLYGSHLPSIQSQEEQFMVTQFLLSVNVKNGSEVWLGGRQMDLQNFNWVDGSQFNYSFWTNNVQNFPSEKCAEMSWRNGRWNDINCKLKRAVLCERQATTTVSSAGNQQQVQLFAKPNLYNKPTSACFGSTNNAELSNCANNSSSSSSAVGQVALTGQTLGETGASVSMSQASPVDASAVSLNDTAKQKVADLHHQTDQQQEQQVSTAYAIVTPLKTPIELHGQQESSLSSSINKQQHHEADDLATIVGRIGETQQQQQQQQLPQPETYMKQTNVSELVAASDSADKLTLLISTTGVDTTKQQQVSVKPQVSINNQASQQQQQQQPTTSSAPAIQVIVSTTTTGASTIKTIDTNKQTTTPIPTLITTTTTTAKLN